MRDTVREFLGRASRLLPLAEPIVEFGSYQTAGQEGFADLRAFFSGKSYIGCDVVAGPGVDRIEDLHHLTFPDASVGTAIAVETLEHVADPYRAVGEIHRVLRSGGVLIASIPFNFPIHYMPDYTRLTPEGMARLLAGFDAAAVFAEGDAQNPATVYGLALKDGTQADAVRFEAAATRLQTAWQLSGTLDPLIRFTPLLSVARFDEPDRPSGDLSVASGIEQRFVCAHNGLTRIDVKFDLSRSLHPATLRFALHNSDGSVLATVDMPTRYIPHERWIAFQFPALPASAKQQFRFTLSCSEPAIAAIANSRRALPDTRLLRAGVEHSGTLSFEAFCERPPAAGTAGAAAPAPRVASAADAALVTAARIQAAELHHAATQLHAELAQLRNELADISNRLDRVRVGVVDELAATLRRYWPVRALLRLLGRPTP